MLEKVTTTPAEFCCCSEKDFIRFFFKLVILSHYLMHTVRDVFYQHLAVVCFWYRKAT